MASILGMAKDATMHQAELIVKDAGYVPAEKFPWCPMGCAKTALGILAEIAGSNMEIAACIRGGQQGASEEQFQQRVKQAATLDDVGPLVIESARAVCAAIDTHREADLESQVQMPWGAVFPLSMAIFLPASHMTYHDGQINYIQTLLGDERFHWAEG